jgi:hypothetical protein
MQELAIAVDLEWVDLGSPGCAAAANKILGTVEHERAARYDH